MYIYGTNTGETIDGSFDSIDNIYGLGGNDVVRGWFGTDFIDGGDGND